MSTVFSADTARPAHAPPPAGILRKWLFKPYAPSPGFVPELNGLRVLLVFIVSWYHIWQQSWVTPPTDFLVRAGYMPVDGTILLSGFLLFLPHARTMVLGERVPDLRSFYQRRVMRIVPSYYFITFVMLFAVAAPGLWSNAHPDYAQDPAWWDRWRGLTDLGPVMALPERMDWVAERYGGPVYLRLWDFVFCFALMAALLYLIHARAFILRAPGARLRSPQQGWAQRLLSSAGLTSVLIAVLALSALLFHLLMTDPLPAMTDHLTAPGQRAADDFVRYLSGESDDPGQILTWQGDPADAPQTAPADPQRPLERFAGKLAALPGRFSGDFSRFVSEWVENLTASFGGNRERMQEDILRHLTFTLTYDIDTYVSTPLGVASWTIAIEMQFYLIFPLLARLARKNPLAVFACMAAAAFGFRLWSFWSAKGYDYNMYVNQVLNFLDVYAMGMAAALLYVKLTTLWPRKRWLQLVWSIIATYLMFVAFTGLEQVMREQAGHPYSPSIFNTQGAQMMNRPLFGALLALLTLTLPFTLRPIRFLAGNRLVGFLAMISMNYYLIHQNFAVYLKQRLQLPFSQRYPTPNYPSPEQPWADEYTFLCFAGSLLLAIGATYLIEKPGAWLLGHGFRKANQAADSLLARIKSFRRKKVSP